MIPGPRPGVGGAPGPAEMAAGGRAAAGYRDIRGRGAHPAILFLRAFEGMIATSSQMRLLVWKSRVRRA